MFKFFRNNVVTIGWSIVIFFAATMFTGGLFFGFNFSGADDVPETPKDNNFASLGNYPINVEYFSQFLNSYLAAVYNQTDSVSPIQLEQIILESFNKIVEQDAFYLAASNSNLELTSVEKKSMEKEFLLENNIKSKSELKKILKKNKRSYKSFQKSLNRELLVRKFKNIQLSNIIIDDYVIDNSFKSYKYDILVITNSNFSESDLAATSHKIISDLNTTSMADVEKAFEAIVTINYVSNEEYVTYDQLDADLRGLISKELTQRFLDPICKDTYCYTIRFNDVKLSDKPADFNIEEYSQQLTSFLQNEKLTNVLTSVFEQNPLNVFSPDIKAVYYKSIKDYSKSLTAYQELSSNLPESPVPHFFRAEIFKKLQNNALVLEELQKADLKSKLAVESDFAELHIFYADELIFSDRNKAQLQYKKAAELSVDKLEYLKLIKQKLEDHNFKTDSKEINMKIALLEEKIKKEQKETKLQDELLLTPNYSVDVVD
jgi:hypothetical protein